VLVMQISSLRAHLPVREGDTGLDHTVAPDARTGRPLDLAGDRRLHTAPAGPPTRRRSPPSMGTQIRPEETDPCASAQRVSATPCNTRHTRPCTEIHHARSGPAKGTRKPPRTRYPAVKKAASAGSTSNSKLRTEGPRSKHRRILVRQGATRLETRSLPSDSLS
jgi:hypothetical protein